MRRHEHKAGAKPAALVPGVAVVVLFFLTSCGASPATSSASPGTRFPVSIAQPGGTTVTIAQRPRRIVSLSPTATEMLFAIGAGSQVIAVDDQSNYPSSAPKTKLSGFTPNIEAIAGYTPDLVVAAEDTGGLVHGLQALNIAILLEPAAKDLDGSYLQIRQLGAATGHPAEADSLVAKMRSKVGAFVASVAKPARQLRVYHELDNTYYSATSATFIGQVYKL